MSGAGEEAGSRVIEAVDGPVARLTLNRPDKRNALDSGLIADLRVALIRAGENDAVRVVTLTGAGPDFSAGADLAALERLASATVVANHHDADALADLFLTIRNLRRPVIALVRGRALAGGCGLATACDLVLATESSTFGYTEVRLGFVPAIVMGILRRNTSEKRAFEMAVTGDLYPAKEMERRGLINRVFPDEAFEAGAEEFVQALAARSASAIEMTKRHLYGQETTGFEDAMRAGAVVNTLARMTEDTRAGVAAFLRRRGDNR